LRAATDAAVAEVRGKRLSIDRRMALLRGRLQQADPRRFPARWWAARMLPVVATGLFAWMWKRSRRPGPRDYR
jgi:hypothetical protein